MKPPDIEVAAARLREAYGGPGIAPMRDCLAPLDLASAYRIQDRNIDHWTGAGRRPVGWKVGLTSPAIRNRLGVEEPDCGMLFADMQLPDGNTLAPDAVSLPRVEPEIALILSHDVDSPPPSPADMAAHVGFAAPAIEIAGSRIRDWAISGADTIADNASSGAFVLGEPIAGDWTDGLQDVLMTMAIDGREVAIGTGREAFGGPLSSLHWLAATLSRRGYPLRAGDIVLTGALAPMRAPDPGSLIEVAIGSLGRVQMRYGKS